MKLLAASNTMGTQEPSASKVAEYNGKDDPEKRWASWTCTLGWPVQV